MRSFRPWLALAVAVLAGWLVWLVQQPPGVQPSPVEPNLPTESHEPNAPASAPLPGEALMQAYGDPSTSPIEDLQALDRVLTGYFSIIKNDPRHPIGGNEDLAAALRGENANLQEFLPADHPAFDAANRLIDRWGTPLFVHPVAGREIELRSAGPDQTMFTEDDVTLAPK